MTIFIPETLEAHLREQAKRSGMDTETYVAGLLAKAIAPTASANSLAEMFDQMQKEQWTDDPAEINRRAREEAEFMEAMNRNRVEMEGPNARKIYP
jgi:hypothetical protein